MQGALQAHLSMTAGLADYQWGNAQRRALLEGVIYLEPVLKRKQHIQQKQLDSIDFCVEICTQLHPEIPLNVVHGV
jgi:hypothetical protein